MGYTEFALNHALAVQRWSNELAIEAEVLQYFRPFMGTGDDAIIKIQKELEKKAGEKITVALRMKLSGDGAEGDNPIEDTSYEEELNFFNDALTVDQRRKSTKTKGAMTQQRVTYDLRKESKDALATWWAEDYDQMMFMYLSGARGIDTSFHVPVGFTGRASNSLEAPDADHIIYGGNATGKADIDSGDVMALSMLERLVSKAETTDPLMRPVRVEGENKFILLMHTFQAYNIRVGASTNDWLDIRKNTDGKESLIYKNALGEYAGVVMHKHRNVIRFSDYGATGNLPAARALFLGAHAGIAAWGGNRQPNRYTWNEETADRGNRLVVTAGSIYGVKKSRYNSKDFGVIAVDTYAIDPA